MSWAAAAVAGGAIVGGLIQSDAAGKASGAQAGATKSAIQAQTSSDAQNRIDMAPYREAGQSSIRELMSRLGLATKAPTWDDAAAKVLEDHKAKMGVGYVPGETDMNVVQAETQRVFDNMQKDYQGAQAAGNPNAGSLNKQFTVNDFWADPVTKLGFDSGMSEGTKAIDRMAGARGMRNSGATAKALTRFGEDYAGQKAGDSYNRFYGDQDRTFNRLSGVAGTGQTATTNTASLGSQTAGRVGDLISAGGNARGAAAISSGNAFSQGLNTVGNWWSQQNSLDKILASRGGGGGNPAYGSAGYYNLGS